MKYLPMEKTIVRFWICDWLVEGVYIDGKFRYGKDIEPYTVQTPNVYKKWERRIGYDKKGDANDFYYIPSQYLNSRRDSIRKSPILYKDIPKTHRPFSDIKKEVCPNDKLNCPILIETWQNDYERFPILSEYDVQKVFPAEKIWLMLSEWLGREKVILNNQSDEEKILSNGFDLKTSFRHPVNTPKEKI
jgi:hypothetical protein